MSIKNYPAVIVFSLISLAGFIVGIADNNKNVLLASYTLVTITLVAYVILDLKIIKKEISEIKEVLKTK